MYSSDESTLVTPQCDGHIVKDSSKFKTKS